MILRNTKLKDYDRVLNVMIDWWGGRDLRNTVYKGFFVHFTETSFIVEDQNGSPIAFLLGFLSQTYRDEAFINWIGVHPDWRKKGIAKMLYSRFFEIARENERGRVTCTTALVNTDSMRWHRHMGFSVEEKQDSFFFSKDI